MTAIDLYAVSYGDWIEIRKAKKPPTTSNDALVTERSIQYSAPNPEWRPETPDLPYWIIKTRKVRSVHPNVAITGGRVVRSFKADAFYRLVGARLKKGTIMHLTSAQAAKVESDK